MSYEARWTDEAKITVNENIEFLSKTWDSLTINNFLDRVDEVIALIESNPKLYPLHREKDNVYKCVVNKHITLFYKIVNQDRIDLISFWNTHKDPKSLKL